MFLTDFAVKIAAAARGEAEGGGNGDDFLQEQNHRTKALKRGPAVVNEVTFQPHRSHHPTEHNHLTYWRSLY